VQPPSLRSFVALGAVLAACDSSPEPPAVAASPDAPGLGSSTSTDTECRTFAGSGFEACFRRRSLAIGTTNTAMSVGDVNGDGLADVAVASSGPDRVEVLVDLAQTPDSRVVELPGPGQGVVFAHLDADATLDLAAGYYDWKQDSFFVLPALGLDDGSFELGEAVRVPRGPLSLTAGELDTGRGVEVVVTSALDTQVTVLSLQADSTFDVLASLSLEGDPTAAYLADLGGDGIVDLSVVEARRGESGLLRVYEGVGNGAFEHVQTLGTGPDPNSLTVADFDGDMHPDVALLSDVDAGVLQIASGTSGNAFSTLVEEPASSFPHSVAHGDLDGDGVEDLVVIAGATSDVLVYAGNGDGTFRDPIRFTHDVLDPVAVSLAHVDFDAQLDILVLGYEGQLAALLTEL